MSVEGDSPGQVLERPRDRRIHRRHLERGTLSGLSRTVSVIETPTNSMDHSVPLSYHARHGETACSLTGHHTGWMDLLMTPRGERNARQPGGRLHDSMFVDQALSGGTP